MCVCVCVCVCADLLTLKEWRKVVKIPKNSSVVHSFGSSPKNNRVLWNCRARGGGYIGG